MKLLKGNIIYTPSPSAFCVVAGGYVGIESGRVAGVWHSGELPEEFAGCEVADYGDSLIIPAMNDLHVHAPQYRNQGIAMDLELLDWLQRYTFPEEAKYADIGYAERMYRRFVHDLWREGTMRASVFASLHTEATRKLIELFDEAGFGARVGKVFMDRNCPENLCESVDDAVKGFEQLLEEFGDENRLVKLIVTPRFIPSCTPEMLKASAELAHTHNLPVQSHLSENRSEIATVKKLEPESKNYGDAYYRYGLFGQTPTIMAHCVYTDGEELELMRRQGVIAAHCPTSNLNVSSGIQPVRLFLDAGISVGLGSDISAGHTLSLFRVMEYALQMSKMVYVYRDGLAPLTLPEVFWMATKNGGSFFGKVGSFEKGYDFDALVIDDTSLNTDNYTVIQRLERFIYLGDDRQITHRYCRGRLIPEPRL